MAKKAKLREKPRKTRSKPLTKVPVEFVFWCHDGCIFSDLNELAEGLKTMSDETFIYHSNLEKHDFANWVRDIIGDEELANELAGASNRLEAVTYITARVS
jgi:hypothetical protein